MGIKPHYEHDSLEFYRTHAARYAELSQGFWDNGYTNCSHPNFRGDRDLYQRLTQLVPGGCGLDAGCGAGARDVFLLSQLGYHMTGLDAVEENIRVARQVHPEIADRLRTADLGEPLPLWRLLAGPAFNRGAEPLTPVRQVTARTRHAGAATPDLTSNSTHMPACAPGTDARRRACYGVHRNRRGTRALIPMPGGRVPFEGQDRVQPLLRR